MSSTLDFEKTIIALEMKIKELETFSKENDVDLWDEINILRDKLISIQREIYANLTPWQKVKIARLQERPTTLEYLKRIIPDFIELHGDRFYGDDCAIVGGIGTLDGIAVTVIGHQKGRDTKENIKRNFGMAHPEGYRKALRLMKQAEKFKRPVLMFIDTPGAYCGIAAEERGQGEAIAVNLLEMSRLKTPVMIVVIGEGGSGGALALGIGDRVCMLEHSVYSVISPEGLSTILWKDVSFAEKAAGIMKLTAQDLLEMKVIDKIIAEPLGGAHKDIEIVSKNIKDYFMEELPGLLKLDVATLLGNRYQKIRDIG